MFVMASWDLYAVTTVKLGCCTAAEYWSSCSSSTMLGIQFKRGFKISGLVGHVYPGEHLCVCVLEGWERNREKMCKRETKLQVQHMFFYSAFMFTKNRYFTQIFYILHFNKNLFLPQLTVGQYVVFEYCYQI